MNQTELNDIVIALNSGLVPRSGIEHLMVGREELIEAVGEELDKVKNGSSLTKFLIGRYGTGKSFVQAMIMQKGLAKNFVVSKVDFSPFRRLYNNEGMARATYSEIVKNMVSKTSSENAIQEIIERWLTARIEETKAEKGQIDTKYLEQRIRDEIKEIDNCFGGADFADVLIFYFRALLLGDEAKQRAAIRWISGEYSRISDAHKDGLEVSTLISDANYYEFLKVLCKFVTLAGYSGLIINFDEVVNLYKISMKPVRDKNYEMILRIINDTVQGDVHNLYITFSGTPDLLEDEFRGMYSYGALKRRLSYNEYDKEGKQDFSQPVIKLRNLTNEEVFTLLVRLKQIHELYYKYNSSLSNEEIINFQKYNYENAAKLSLTTGDIVKNFFGLLNVLHKNPELKTKILAEWTEQVDSKKETTEDVLSRFEAM